MNFTVWFITVVIVSICSWLPIIPKEATQKVSIEIAGQWKFNNTTDDYTFIRPEYNDSNWSQILVPATWESQGHGTYDGVAWYRCHIKIPEYLKNKSLVLVIGKIDDSDEVYFNGILIGRTTAAYQKLRIYGLSSKIIKFGEDNVIAVRVEDTGGNGGIWEGPLKIEEGFMPLRYSVE